MQSRSFKPNGEEKKTLQAAARIPGLNPTTSVTTVHNVQPSSVTIKEVKVPPIVHSDLFVPTWLPMRLKTPPIIMRYMYPVSQTFAHHQTTAAG